MAIVYSLLRPPMNPFRLLRPGIPVSASMYAIEKEDSMAAVINKKPVAEKNIIPAGCKLSAVIPKNKLIMAPKKPISNTSLLFKKRMNITKKLNKKAKNGSEAMFLNLNK